MCATPAVFIAPPTNFLLFDDDENGSAYEDGDDDAEEEDHPWMWQFSLAPIFTRDTSTTFLLEAFKNPAGVLLI